MKKSVIIFLLFVSHLNFAQNIFPNNGNVGIGTLNPTQALDVNGNGIFKGGILSDISGTIGGYVGISNSSKISDGLAQRWVIYNMSGGYGNSLQFWAYDNLGCVAGGLCANRFTIMDNGNVGVGVFNPLFKLDVNGVLNVTSENNGGGLRFNSAANGQSDSRNWYISSDSYAYGDFAIKSSLTNSGLPDQTKLIIKGNGNIGIGSNTPDSKLEISGSSQIGYEVGTLKLKSSALNQFMYFGYDDQYSAGYIQSVKPGTNQQNILLAPVGGNIGIGTTSPDEKLTVKGKIHTQEVKVDLLGALVPDYVFAANYKLKTLQEVEAYIKTNNHLPEVPSAAAIEKNGLMLAEMNMSLLKKVEELTLYAIEQEKKIDTQSEAIEALKKENESFKKLSERLSIIEKELNN